MMQSPASVDSFPSSEYLKEIKFQKVGKHRIKGEDELYMKLQLKVGKINCYYFWLAVTDTSLVVVRYCSMAANEGLSLGVTSQHCIISRYRSGGQASGRERRWPSRRMRRRIAEPFKPNIRYKLCHFSFILIVDNHKRFQN